jgi:hypothetical protein
MPAFVPRRRREEFGPLLCDGCFNDRPGRPRSQTTKQVAKAGKVKPAWPFAKAAYEYDDEYDENGEYIPYYDRPLPNVFYHVSPTQLPVGTVLMPHGPEGTTTNFGDLYQREIHRGGFLYLTTEKYYKTWGDMIPGEDYVYRVEPLGEVTLSPSYDDREWVTRDGARIVEIVRTAMRDRILGKAGPVKVGWPFARAARAMKR